MKKVLENLVGELAQYTEIPGVAGIRTKVEQAIGGEI
jgi:hypothetical protein